MIYSCCATMEQYDKIKSAGYDGIILSAVEINLMDEQTLLLTKYKLENGTLKCLALNDFCTSDLKLCGPGFNLESVRAYSRRLVERSSILGIENIGIGAPKSRYIPIGFSRDQAMEELKHSLQVISKEASAYNLDILLEAVCDVECNFITTTDEAFELVESLGIENIHLVFDTYHAFKMKEDEIPLLRAIHEVKLVHVAQDIQKTRRYPQEGFQDEHQVYFKALLNGGYDGEISVEASPINVNGELTETLHILKNLCGE
jgi:hydroxypyruvate isomerase